LNTKAFHPAGALPDGANRQSFHSIQKTGLAAALVTVTCDFRLNAVSTHRPIAIRGVLAPAYSMLALLSTAEELSAAEWWECAI